MRDYFYGLADKLDKDLVDGEIHLATFFGETSDFCRFNGAKVRQAGRVENGSFSIKLIRGKRHADYTFTLSGRRETDEARLGEALKTCRKQLEVLPEDPYLLYATEVSSSEQVGEDLLPDPRETVERISRQTAGLDMVGIYASGPVFRGFANSLGQRNWFANHSFNFDWSFYLRADKAVKDGYAGFSWKQEEFDAKVERAREGLSVLEREPRDLKPGKYRAYLTPSALTEVMDLLSWGGFSKKAVETKTTPLNLLVEGKASFAPGVTLKQNTKDGTSAPFSQEGFTLPEEVVLVEGGSYKESLVSPRSAEEYKVKPNAGTEAPNAIDLAGGDLARADVLEKLGTGLYINNLWYLNYSDRPHGRMTGMTRFATYWVENGKIVSPVNVMRFDESLYRLLGENLIGLTREREMIMSTSTYGWRSTGSYRLPGALVSDLTLTL